MSTGMKTSEIRVSDHALVRYLERRYKLHTDELRAEILTPDRVAAIKAGASRISCKGFDFVVKNGVVVTVID